MEYYFFATMTTFRQQLVVDVFGAKVVRVELKTITTHHFFEF